MELPQNLLQTFACVASEKNLSPKNGVASNFVVLQTRSLYRLQGSPCVLILPCKDPVKIIGYHSNPSSPVVGTL